MASQVTKNAPAGLFPCDLGFLIIAASFALITLQGIVIISGNGAILDSDLQTYAQGMAGAANPRLFAADPVLASHNPANSIPNIERMIAAWLTPGDNYAIGLLRAGACAIFVFYTGWYAFGRLLYGSPALAALLSLCSGITIWVGWGTFWGVTHSDPVPRVFYAAIFPYLLCLCLVAIKKIWLRPVCMLLAGASMWVHGVSALNCGAMFLLAFTCLKPASQSIRAHIRNLSFCLFAFFTPVLIFLWPSFAQPKNFSPGELDIFKQLFELRWHMDYADFWANFRGFFSPSHPVFPLLAAALPGWVIAFTRGAPKEKTMCRMIPPFVCALLLVALFCWLETEFAPAIGRLPMGHELVRGLRFFVPLSWIVIIAAIGCVAGVLIRRILLVAALILIISFNSDRQWEAFEYALWKDTGIALPLVKNARLEMFGAEKYRAMMEEIKSVVPEGEPVFSDSEDMAVRFMAGRPLIHTFKDGYVHFYNKDLRKSEQWLDYEKLINSEQDGSLKAWLKSGAPWFLGRDDKYGSRLRDHGTVMLEANGRILIHRKEGM